MILLRCFPQKSSSSSSSIYDSDLRLVDTGQALSYRFIRSIGLSDLPIIWFNLYPSRNRSGFLWYPTTWALICRHRASISSSSWDLPHGLYQSFMETEVGSSVVIIDNCSLVMSKDILILWSSSIRDTFLMTPSEYLTLFSRFQASDIKEHPVKRSPWSCSIHLELRKSSCWHSKPRCWYTPIFILRSKYDTPPTPWHCRTPFITDHPTLWPYTRSVRLSIRKPNDTDP